MFLLCFYSSLSYVMTLCCAKEGRMYACTCVSVYLFTTQCPGMIFALFYTRVPLLYCNSSSQYTCYFL
jgi:hypothetical protein